MNLKIRIRCVIHAIAREQLCDEIFENGLCIHGTEIVHLLKQKKDLKFVYEYTRETTLDEINSAIRKAIGVDIPKFDWVPLIISFLYHNERYYVDNYGMSFSRVLEKYLAPNNEDIITAEILLSCDAGDVGFAYPLRFYVHSHEAGSHNKPHIHVSDRGHNYDATISIESGDILVGMLPPRLAKVAKEEILSKQEYYYECWNTQTDGLQVDINHHLGIIQY